MAKETFAKELQVLLNKYSKEMKSNTPDVILTEYIVGCLSNYNRTLRARDKWFGIGNS